MAAKRRRGPEPYVTESREQLQPNTEVTFTYLRMDGGRPVSYQVDGVLVRERGGDMVMVMGPHHPTTPPPHHPTTPPPATCVVGGGGA